MPAVHSCESCGAGRAKFKFPFLFEGTEINEKENGGLRDQRPRDPRWFIVSFYKSLTSAWHRCRQRRVENFLLPELRLVATESQMRLPLSKRDS